MSVTYGRKIADNHCSSVRGCILEMLVALCLPSDVPRPRTMKDEEYNSEAISTWTGADWV